MRNKNYSTPFMRWLETTEYAGKAAKDFTLEEIDDAMSRFIEENYKTTEYTFSFRQIPFDFDDFFNFKKLFKKDTFIIIHMDDFYFVDDYAKSGGLCITFDSEDICWRLSDTISRRVMIAAEKSDDGWRTYLSNERF